MPDQKSTQRVYGVLLGNNVIQELEMSIADNLETAIVNGKQAWYKQNPGLINHQAPRLVMSNSIEVQVQPFQLVESSQEGSRDSPVTNYENLAMLLRDHLNSEEGKDLKERGWSITQTIINK